MWDGHRWQRLGQTNEIAGSLLAYGNELIVAGPFSAIDCMVTNHLAYLVPHYECDINADGQVNVGDLLCLVIGWGCCSNDERFSAACDISGDGHVNVGDLQLLIANWGT